MAASWLPGTVTNRFSPGSGPGSTPPSTAPPTLANVDAADVCPAASTVTARYSMSAPSGSPVTVWNTRGDVVSAVPSGVQSSSPTTRYPNEVWLQTSSATSALTATSPDRPAPGAGAVSAMAPGAAGAPTVAPAFSTIALRAGIVTETVPSAAAVTPVDVPYSGVNVAPGVRVSMVTVVAVVPLFVATRCSTFSAASTRLNA